MKNPYAEAIGFLFSGKSLRQVIIWIVQNYPGTFCKAFRACYPPIKFEDLPSIVPESGCDCKRKMMVEDEVKP
jgi:hypothetical protein